MSRVSGSGSSSDLNELSEALSKLFRINVTLNRLNFWETSIAPAFTASVFESLRGNRALRHLDISQIGTISSDQLGHLGAALTKNRTLASLLLENNNISGYGLETLYKALLVEKEEVHHARMHARCELSADLVLIRCARRRRARRSTTTSVRARRSVAMRCWTR